eukprot:6577112-Prorocentrum_lima.AAC.1
MATQPVGATTCTAGAATFFQTCYVAYRVCSSGCASRCTCTAATQGGVSSGDSRPKCKGGSDEQGDEL